MKILFTNSDVEVRISDCHEVFVTNARTNTTMRISTIPVGLRMTSMGNELYPTSVNGLSAIEAIERR